MKPKTIVSVLESSPSAHDAALSRALSLARRYEADLHVVEVGAARRAGASERAALIGRIALTAGAGLRNLTPVVLTGRPVPAVAEYARRVGADLVVAGLEVRRGDGYWSAGAFAAALGAATGVPTLTVGSEVAPADSSRSPFATIVAAVDFPDVSMTTVRDAHALAEANDGRLLVLHAMEGYAFDASYSGTWALTLLDEIDERVAEVRKELRSQMPFGAVGRHSVDVVAAAGSPADAIVAAAVEASADLIVLGRPRPRRYDHLLVSSIAHKVVRRATCPVLLVPEPASVIVPGVAAAFGSAAHPVSGDWVPPAAAVAADRAAAR